MNDNTQQPKPAPQKPPGDRQPIRIKRLLFTSPNVHGIKLPSGPDGKSEKIVPNLYAGIHGDEKTEISHLPWLRVFQIVKTKRVSRSGEGKDAKEIVTWEPMGEAFRIPDTWAVSIPVEE